MVASREALEFWIDNFSDRCWDDKCLLWTGGCFTSGYGSVRIDGKSKRVHRIAYERYYGPIPKGLCVCHKCDNPKCVNPQHLFLATHKQNMEDKVEKNRQWKHGHPLKLSPDQIKQLKSEYTGKYGDKIKLAKKFNINRNTVREYLLREEGELWEPPMKD